jgi:hypothetical protein
MRVWMEGLFLRSIWLIHLCGVLRPGFSFLASSVNLTVEISRVDWLCSLVQPYLAIAGAAIHRSALSGLEWHLSFLATLSASCRILLQIRSGSATPLRFSRLSAGLAALRFISITLLCEKLLLRSSECEIISTFDALDLLVGKTH